MRLSILLVGALTVAACSSDSEGTGCPDIVGNYSYTSARLSGSCDVALDPKGSQSFSIAKGSGANEYTAVLPGITGGCPGTLDAACKFRSNCELRGQDGALLGTATVDYAFTANGFEGTSVNGLNPPAVAQRCEATYRDTGTKP